MQSISYICGIFYAEKKGEESSYGNAKGSSSSKKFQEVYWKNMISFYATARRTNPQAKLVLFSNSTPPKAEWNLFFEKLEVEIINIEYSHQPPKGHWHAWQSTFYIIDCLNYLISVVKESDYIYFLDIDCLIVNNLGEANKVLKRDGFLNYGIDYDLDRKIHGVSLDDMNVSFSKIEEKSRNHPIYFGGELYGIFGLNNLSVLYKEASKAWKMSIVDKKLSFNTEEHLFTYVFWKLEKDYNNSSDFIKRIWTDSSNTRNVKISDLDLTIWHLPAEKNKGLLKIYKEVLNAESSFWHINLADFNTYLGNFVSIPNRGLKRIIIEKFKKEIKRIVKIFER